MLDPAQNVLLLVIVVLAILLLVLGIQVFIILQNLRKTIAKANKILDDTGVIAESVSKPISFVSSSAGQFLIAALAILLNFKKGKEFFKVITDQSKNEGSSPRKKTSERKKSFEVKAPTNGEEEIKKPVRRFFRGVPRNFYRS